MNLQCCAVYDQKARAFLPPFFVPHLDVAYRAIANATANPDHPFHRNPEDYIVYQLGSWSDDTAMFQLLGEPLNLGLVLNFKGATSVRKIA